MVKESVNNGTKIYTPKQSKSL